jgi:hypothetical protein
MIVGSNILAGASGQGGYFLNRSVRLRSSAGGNFTRTPASTTSQTTCTWSGWVKLGAIGTGGTLFSATFNPTPAQNVSWLQYDGTTLSIVNYVSNVFQANVATIAVFRDPSAWYHMVFVWDTTNATATDRCRIYVNGVRQTLTFTNTPPLNNAAFFNTAYLHTIGRDARSAGGYFDGYLAEINFIDGQALTPTSFGEYNVLTGVWQPKKYGGTYGTNGFYLNFNDNSAATAAAIGKDSSGNGNNWTPNNISVTAGVTYDSMTDVPTLTSVTQANYCTLNPNISNDGTAAYSNGNLTMSGTPSYGVASTIPVSAVKSYWEVRINANASQDVEIGIQANPGNGVSASGGYGWGTKLGRRWVNGSATTGFATATIGDIVGFAYDNATGQLNVYKNNTLAFSITGIPTSVDYWVAVSGGGVPGADGYTFNFGQQPFTYTPPSGFVALNTYNLPTPTISNGATQMAATLYTGNGTTQTITNGGNNPIGITFQPDFVWMKNRTIAQIHGWFDSVRGVGNLLSSDQTSVESSGSAGVSSFNSNGFGLGNVFNNNTNAFVAWQWKASNAAAVTNTSGTISSQVSANPTAGFSVVTYTGTGTNGATFGHGLGVAPAFGIWKVRTGTIGNWVIYHQSLGATRGLNFTTGAATTSAVFFNNTAPTSTVWSLGTVTDVNRSTSTYVNYAFSEIAGYSKFGSYTGNGSADGVFVYLGFRPRWLLIKRTDSTGGWNLYDSTRNPYNVADLILQPNNSNAEASGITFPSAIDFLSNGFKTRNYDATYGPNINANGGTYIYAAFAENPTKFALAR